MKSGYFKPWTYFSKDMADAIEMGGPVVFLVVFIKEDLPNYWQAFCQEKIPISRIVATEKITKEVLTTNCSLLNQIDESTKEDNLQNPGYAFYDNYSKYYDDENTRRN